jgi:hypothetical protein
MNDGVSTAGFFPFGYVTNVLSTIQRIDGSTAQTYKSNPGALKDHLDKAMITPDNRSTGSSLAAQG